MEKIIAAIKKCGTEIKIPIEQEKEHSKKRTKLAQLKARQDIFIGKVKTYSTRGGFEIRHCTALDDLPQVPQVCFENLGRRKPNGYAMPQVPQVAPSVFNYSRQISRRKVCDGWQKNKFAPAFFKSNYCGVADE